MLEAIPRDKWTAWANVLSLYRKPDDIGLGDTARRVFARLGGEGFKWLAKKIGMTCGCVERQKEWNVLYPYCDSVTQRNDDDD